MIQTILVTYLSGVYGRGLSKMEVIFTERICSRGGEKQKSEMP